MDQNLVLERELTSQLVDALRELPHMHAHIAAQPKRHDRYTPDAEIRLEGPGADVTLIVEAKRSIYPRDVREILWQMRQFGALDKLREHATAVVPLLVAHSISPGAKQMLEEEKVGYFDSGGSLFIPARCAYIYIEKPPPKALAKSMRALFKGKRAQVLHALLHSRDEWFGLGAIAELAQVSTTTASETLTELERIEWVTARGQGPAKERKLENPKAILNEWARQVQAARQAPYRRYYVSGANSDKLADHIAEVCAHRDTPYAITQESAAQRYAPFLTTIARVACRLPPGRAAEAVVGELGARVVAEGANLIVIETPTQGEFLFKERVGDVWLASPVQVYLDLQQAGGRAKEMADHLRKEKIGF